jgi:hypothetical protein
LDAVAVLISHMMLISMIFKWHELIKKYSLRQSHSLASGIFLVRKETNSSDQKDSYPSCIYIKREEGEELNNTDEILLE